MKPFDPALLRALPDTRGPVALLSVVGVASGVVSIAQAVLLAVTVWRVVSGGPLTPVLSWLVALLIARGLLAGLTEVVARRAGLKVVGAVRQAVLRHWLGRPEGGRPATDVAVTRATEGVSALEDYVSRYLPALVTAAVVPTLAVLTMLVIDPWSALIVVLTLPLLPLFAALIGQHTQDETARRWDAMALLAGHFLDVVRGLPTLVAYGRARAQVGVVREVGERHRRATVRTLRTAFLSTAALELLATISVALVAVAVGLRLAYGQVELVVGLAAILLAPEAYWPVRRVGQEFHNAADGAAVLEELAADGVLGDVDPAGGAAGAPSDSGISGGDIRLSQVSYAHPGRRRSVVDITLATPATPGLTALTGVSGAGKTTVLELLAGLRTADAGRVEAPRAHLASQRPVVLPGTVRDNLALALRDRTAVERPRRDSDPAGASADDLESLDRTFVAALDQVGLWSQLTARDGLDTRLGDDGFGLSAGQRARLALARALLSDAPLVLLDEPTAAVAADSLPHLHRVIREQARTRRVVVVTHDPALAALADQQWELTPAPADASSGQAAMSTATGTAGVCSNTPSDAPEAPEAPEPQTSLPAATGSPADATADTTAEPGVVAPLPLPQGRAGLATACLLGGASVACGVALTATSGWLIVQASTMPVILTLMVAIVGVRAFGIFRPVFRYAERVVSHDVALDDLAGRRADVFARLIPLTPARLGRRSRGEVLTAVVRDLDDVVDEQVRVTVPAWSTLIASVVGAVLAAWHLPAAGALVAGGTVLAGLVALTTQRWERAAQEDAVAARGEVQHRTTALTGRLLAVQSVTGLGADPTPLLSPVAAAEGAHHRAEARLIRVRALGIAALWLVVAGTAATVAALTWQAHAAGQVSGPYAALVALIPLALADAWVGLADVAGARARARAASDRLAHVLDQRPAVAGDGAGLLPQAATVSPELTLQRVSARWDAAGTTESASLAPLDLQLAAGSRVALVGPNGVGKSTALAVLARQLDPATGRYEVGGHDVLDLDLQAVRSLIAIVDDEPHAFAGPVRANLLLAAPPELPTGVAGDAVLIRALEAVDLGHWYDTLPDGLDTPLSGLSGGERARLALARALVSDRPIVLLDEPTAHLDDATADRALAGLLVSRERTTGAPEGAVVMVSHRPVDPRWSTVRLTHDLAPHAEDDAFERAPAGRIS